LRLVCIAVSHAARPRSPPDQYDLSDFNALVGAISHGSLSPAHLPAVSFLKAPGYQDGHAGYSDPADEQQFVVSTTRSPASRYITGTPATDQINHGS